MFSTQKHSFFNNFMDIFNYLCVNVEFSTVKKMDSKWSQRFCERLTLTSYENVSNGSITEVLKFQKKVKNNV